MEIPDLTEGIFGCIAGVMVMRRCLPFGMFFQRAQQVAFLIQSVNTQKAILLDWWKIYEDLQHRLFPEILGA